MISDFVGWYVATLVTIKSFSYVPEEYSWYLIYGSAMTYMVTRLYSYRMESARYSAVKLGDPTPTAPLQTTPQPNAQPSSAVRPLFRSGRCDAHGVYPDIGEYIGDI